MDTKERILKLREDIKKYNEYYYEKNQSLISDVEYDKILKELEDLERENSEYADNNSPTNKVGSSINSRENKFKKIKHKVAMLSLSNSYNKNDIADFVDRVKKNIDEEQVNFALELKLDGLSISIFYEKGNLVRALTRGDGEYGEDVTENIKEISSIPHKISEEIDLEIRGEVVLPLSSFYKLNEERMKNNEEIFANPRNAASGTLRQLDSKIVAKRGLDAYFYFLVNAENYGCQKHSDAIAYIEKLGLKTTGICEVLSSVDEIEKRIDFWSEERKKMDYETDGLVIKLNELKLWSVLGTTSKSPRWAIAYKFPAEKITTKLLDITWQVGRTGKITPVAELQEVFLSGSNIRRASLHNIDEIKRKDIMIGDTVFIEKAAEIIPQVVSSVKELRTGEEKEILEPTTCPVCHHDLVRESGLVDIKCVNKHCPSKTQGSIEYFVSRDAMNISGLGSKIVEKFIELNYISNIVDIYSLKNHREELEQLDKMGKKSIDNLLNSIEESKNRPFEKVLYALGISYVGKVVAKLLVDRLKNIDSIIKASYDELIGIDGIGDIVAKEVINFFQNEENLTTIQKLKDLGLKFEKEETNTVQNENFTGKTFLVTGTLVHYKREEIREEIEKLGGKFLSSVSKNLDYLVVGENAGSKLEKAKQISSIKILTEQEFIKLTK